MIANGRLFRGAQQLPETVWQAAITRVRAEFDEMPCLRVTPDQARLLFGLPANASDSILSRLVQEGFLVQTAEGHYVRRHAQP